MTVNTGGPIRGFIGRWLMRLEASGKIISIAAQVTTAGSAVSGVLLIGTNVPTWAVVALLIAAVIGGLGFAYAYVEWGLYNRQNHENQLRGRNFAKPQNAIDDAMIARNIKAARLGRELTADERDVIEKESFAGFQDYKNGIRLNE